MEIRTQAIVLRRSEYKDYDRMVSLFSPTHGKIDALARGCRRPKSPLLCAVEPFCAGEYVLYRVQDRYHISQARPLALFEELRLDYEKLTHAAYCLSLAEAVIFPGEPMPELFTMLLKALTHFAKSELPPALITAAFEMRFMPLLGYAPRMGDCVLCGRPIEGEGRFDAVRGGAVCLLCPSEAPRMTNGARRIILRAPRTDLNTVSLLDGHPDWPLAARLYRPFVSRRIERNGKRATPELPEDFKI